MSTFLYALGRTAYQRKWIFVSAWLVVLIALGAFAGMFAKTFNDDFSLPGAESQEALDNLKLTFPQVSGTTGSIIVVAADGDSITDPEYKDPIEDAVDTISDWDHVEAVTDPFDDMVKGTVNDAGTAATVSIQYDAILTELPDGTPDQLSDYVEDMHEDLPDGAQISAGGDLFQITSVAISWVEGVGVVIAFFVLLFTLGTLRAAGLPLITALTGVMVGMLLIVGSTAFATVNSTTPMLALMLGLAVGIDYALFIVSRARVLVKEGADPEEATARAVATAGSAVVFAGLTVIIALVGLGVAGLPFLTVMGIAAGATVAVAVLVALTLVPALLGILGPKLLGRKDRKALAAGDREVKHGFMHKVFGAWETASTKVPALTVIVIVLGLGLFAFPASRLELALPNNGSAEEGTPARETYDLTSEYFGEGYNGPLILTADIIGSEDPLGDMEDLGDEIAEVDGVKQVVLSTPNETATTGIVQIVPEYGPADPRTTQVVMDLRDMSDHFEDEYGFDTAVTGTTAVAIDVSDQLGKALLPFGLFVVGLSFILLMIVFRSIVIPIKATVGYLLSVVAAFGVVVLVFEDGLFAETLGVEQLGPVLSFLPIILMGVLFGLAMDYEVFLVSGMREAYVHGKSAREAIRAGFLSSANVVVAAAIIMFSVFFAFVPAGEPIIKSIALALAVGVFVDAFIVRMTLVPAVLALLGDKAWWLPRWLDRLLPHFDVEGEGLYHQVALADWPEPGNPYSAYGEGLGLHATGTTVFEDVDLAVRPGEVLGITGRGSTGLLLALTGRARLDAGDLKIGANVLPEQAASVRRSTPLVAVNSSRESLITPVSGLRALAADPPALVVIEHADQPHDHEAAEAVSALVAAALAAGSGVVLGLGNPDAGWMVPAGTPYTVLDLDAHAAEPARTTPATASAAPVLTSSEGAL